MSDKVSDHVCDLLHLAVESLEAGPSTTRSEPDPHSSHSTSQTISGASTSRDLLTERNALFNYSIRSKKRKGKGKESSCSKKLHVPVWKHTFFCLSDVNCSNPPSSMEAAELMRAGLGRKEIHITDDGDSSDVHSAIVCAFPKLREAGGYDLLRINEKNRTVLQYIPPLPEGYTVSYLKEAAKQAKVYIRPLQKSLTLNPVPAHSDTFQVINFCSELH